MQKYTEQTTVKKVQKFYSTLSNAYALAIKENGPVSDWGIIGYDEKSNTKVYNLLFKPHFKIAKNCGKTNTENCIKNGNYKLLDNTYNPNDYGTYTVYYKLVLDDGASIIFRTSNSTAVAIFYDMNGIKEPNQWGKDLFSFNIKNDKVFPTGIQSGEYSIDPFNPRCRDDGAGFGCAAWVIYKGNMDYLHCTGLSWTGKDKCK